MTMAWWIPLAAGVAAWMAGAIWYGVLGDAWLAALGKSAEEIRPGGRPPPGPMILSLLADLVMAGALAYMIARAGAPSLATGLAWGALVWLGFVATTIAVNNGFARRNASLTAIDAGHWLVALLVAGAVIGAFG